MAAPVSFENAMLSLIESGAIDIASLASVIHYSKKCSSSCSLIDVIRRDFASHATKASFRIIQHVPLTKGSSLFELIKNEYMSSNSRRRAQFALRIDVSMFADAIIKIPVRRFNVFGCPSSRDIDVAIVVDSADIILQYQRGLAEVDIESLRSQLSTLGYDVTRDVDINLVFIDARGDVSTVAKGGKETQNIIFATFAYHAQACPCIVSRMIEVDINEKIRAAAKFFLDYMKIFIGDTLYAVERMNRRGAYEGGWSRITYAIKIMQTVVINPSSVSAELHDYMKSLVMKLIQIILLEKDIYCYTKKGLAQELNKIWDSSYDCAMWYLFRGTRGVFSDKLFPMLVNEFYRICIENRDEFDWTDFVLDTTVNPTELPDHLITEFFVSPLRPTAKFSADFVSYCTTSSIGIDKLNSMFPIRCRNVDRLPETVAANVIAIDQRSEEWLHLLKFYTCGKDSGTKGVKDAPDDITRYYNLMRGAIVELGVVGTVDFAPLIDPTIYATEYHKVSVGLLVESIGTAGASGCAPDLLISVKELATGTTKVIPCEIKCMSEAPSESHDFRRAVKLARGQLKSTSKLLGGSACDFGIMLIVYVYERETDGSVAIEGRMTKVDF